MPDTIATNSTLQFEFAFVDGDTRQANIKNPKAGITENDIANLNQMIRANNLIVGDRYQSTFAQINYAKRINKTTTTLDIGN